MRDYLTIGCTPAEEDCFPAGHPLALAETRIYLEQLRREFPEADLTIKGFPHDFGTYYEVVARYRNDDEQSINTAYAVEADAPAEWDSIARKELKTLKMKHVTETTTS